MRKKSAFIFSVFIFAALFSGCMTLNPATGKEDFIVFTTPTEVLLGLESHAQIAATTKFSEDKAATIRLRRIGARVAQVADRQDYQYNFFLIDSDEVNAFTTPGGYVYFYRGLYDKLQTDDEIAAVLAHEIGHCSARHVVKKFQAALGYSLVTSYVFSGGREELALRVAKMGADALINLGMLAYSRKDEYEADRLGVKYMTLAGYNPDGMITTFRVLAQESKGDDNDWLLLRSHPRINDRIAAVETEIAAVKQKY